MCIRDRRTPDLAVFGYDNIFQEIGDVALHMLLPTIVLAFGNFAKMCIRDRDLLDDIRNKLSEIHVEALTMAQESLAEALVPHKWLNPFPKVRYTERPDAASSNILEGKVILMIDNSPSVLILPTSFFDFIQEAQDYYLPPITGSYLRIVRILVFFLTLLVTPISVSYTHLDVYKRQHL